MIQKLKGEEWKPIKLKGQKQLRRKYAASSMGRMASYSESIEDGKLLNGSNTSGYRTLNLHIDGQSCTLYFHREIAKLFCSKNSPKEKYVIHQNHDRSDNRAKNLKWVTQENAIAHQQKSPAKQAYKEVQSNRKKGLKLSAAQAKAIKTSLENPKRKLTHKQIADKFGVTEMTIYRIKSGESWAHV